MIGRLIEDVLTMAITIPPTNALSILRLPDGGFVVHEGVSPNDDYGRFRGPLFGCTDIGEALIYVRRKLTEVREV
jgi:hypothetical protein